MYHKPTQNAVKYNLAPRIKVWMDCKPSLCHESYWSNCHDKEIEDKSSQASKSQNSSNNPTNDRHKCSAAQTKRPQVLASIYKCQMFTCQLIKLWLKKKIKVVKIHKKQVHTVQWLPIEIQHCCLKLATKIIFPLSKSTENLQCYREG